MVMIMMLSLCKYFLNSLFLLNSIIRGFIEMVNFLEGAMEVSIWKWGFEETDAE